MKVGYIGLGRMGTAIAGRVLNGGHDLTVYNRTRSKADELEKTKKAGAEILEYCVKVGGAITGEHGVGMEKNDLMPMAFSQDSLDMMETLIKVFDPDGRLNPGKILPTGTGCLEVRPMTSRGQAMDW